MSQRVELPKGCYGLDVPGGGRYNATRSGGHVTVTDTDARKIKSANGDSGMLGSATRLALGTKRGQRCTSETCGFLAQVWAQSCPRCSSPTIEE